METMTDTKSTITLFDGTNSQPQTHFLNTVTTISYVFSPAMNERLHAALVQICMVIQTVVYLSGHCHNAPLNTTLCSHPLFGLQKHLVSVNGCHFFFLIWRNSDPHFCLIHFYISDTIVSDCPSAATCHTETKCNGNWWEGSTFTTIPPTSTSNFMGQRNKIGAAPVDRRLS